MLCGVVWCGVVHTYWTKGSHFSFLYCQCLCCLNVCLHIFCHVNSQFAFVGHIPLRFGVCSLILVSSQYFLKICSNEECLNSKQNDSIRLILMKKLWKASSEETKFRKKWINYKLLRSFFHFFYQWHSNAYIEHENRILLLLLLAKHHPYWMIHISMHGMRTHSTNSPMFMFDSVCVATSLIIVYNAALWLYNWIAGSFFFTNRFNWNSK